MQKSTPTLNDKDSPLSFRKAAKIVVTATSGPPTKSSAFEL